MDSAKKCLFLRNLKLQEQTYFVTEDCKISRISRMLKTSVLEKNQLRQLNSLVYYFHIE